MDPPSLVEIENLRGSGNGRQRFPPAEPETVTVTSAVLDIDPSLAVARRTYVPGSLKRAMVTALPPSTRIGPAVSKRTLAGPRYCIQVTDKPLAW